MLLLTVLILAGCASQERVPPPDWDIDRTDRKQVTDAKALPPLCEIPWAATDVHCWAALDAFDIVAEGNHDIANANANALRNSEMATDAFIEAGRLQKEMSDFYAQLYDDERQAHFIDNAIWKTLLALVAVGAVL